MRARTTGEVITLYCAREPLTFAGAHDVNPLADNKNRNSHLVAFLNIRIFYPELAQELERREIVAF